MSSDSDSGCPYCGQDVGRLPPHMLTCEAKPDDPETGQSAPVASTHQREQYDIDSERLTDYLHERLEPGMSLTTAAKNIADEVDATTHGVARVLEALRDNETSFEIELGNGSRVRKWTIKRRENPTEHTNQ